MSSRCVLARWGSLTTKAMSGDNYSVDKLNKFLGEHDLRILNFRHLDTKQIAIEVSVDGSADQFMVLLMPTKPVKSSKTRTVGVAIMEGTVAHDEPDEEPDLDALFSNRQ